MDPKIVAELLTEKRNTQRLLKYLVLSNLMDKNNLTIEEAEEKLKRLLS